MSDEELINSGMTAEEIDELRSFDFNQVLYERSRMSTEDLKWMGYTDEQILSLREMYGTISKSALQSDFTAEEMSTRGIFADLTLTTSIGKYSDSEISVEFDWSWSNLPAWYGGKDVVGFAWEGTDDNGNPLNVAIDTGSSYHNLNETNNVTGNKTHSGTYDVERTYGAAKSEFQLGYRVEDMIGWYQSGDGEIFVEKTGSNDINEISMNVTYGHTIVIFGPSISFPGGLSISFGSSTLEMDKDVARYTSTGQKITIQ